MNNSSSPYRYRAPAQIQPTSLVDLVGFAVMGAVIMSLIQQTRVTNITINQTIP